MRNIAYADREKHWPTVEWVIHSSGQPLLDYRREFNRARKKIGREDLHFHDLRHAAVTNMVDAGIDESRVMSIVGHKTYAMLRRYRITADRHAVDAGKKLEAWQQQQAAK